MHTESHTHSTCMHIYAELCCVPVHITTVLPLSAISGLQQEFDQMKQLGLPTMFINYYDDMEKVCVSLSPTIRGRAKMVGSVCVGLRRGGLISYIPTCEEGGRVPILNLVNTFQFGFNF